MQGQHLSPFAARVRHSRFAPHPSEYFKGVQKAERADCRRVRRRNGHGGRSGYGSGGGRPCKRQPDFRRRAGTCARLSRRQRKVIRGGGRKGAAYVGTAPRSGRKSVSLPRAQQADCRAFGRRARRVRRRKERRFDNRRICLRIRQRRVLLSILSGRSVGQRVQPPA